MGIVGAAWICKLFSFSLFPLISGIPRRASWICCRSYELDYFPLLFVQRQKRHREYQFCQYQAYGRQSQNSWWLPHNSKAEKGIDPKLLLLFAGKEMPAGCRRRASTDVLDNGRGLVVNEFDMNDWTDEYLRRLLHPSCQSANTERQTKTWTKDK